MAEYREQTPSQVFWLTDLLPLQSALSTGQHRGPQAGPEGLPQAGSQPPLLLIRAPAQQNLRETTDTKVYLSIIQIFHL